MKSIQIIGTIILSLSCLMPPSSLLGQNALGIVNKVDSVNRQSYNSSVTKMQLSTCRYKVESGRMGCVETPRVSVLESIQKHYGVNNMDTRSIAIVLEPARDKGIGMLTYEYFDKDKDNDVWLYLSALGQVKRLVSSSEDGDESGSFFGSEFSVEDIAIRKTENYTYKIIGEETYDNRKTWVIESVPTPEKAKKSKYSKIVSWVDQERFIVLKENLLDQKEQLYKQQIRRNIEQINNIWVVRTTIMNNLQSKRVTELRLISVGYNLDVTDEFLTQRSLTDFAFREKNLTRFRTYMK